MRDDNQNRRVDGEVFGNCLHDFEARFEIDVREGFVEQEDIRLCSERTCDIHALHLSGRQLLRPLVEVCARKADLFEVLFELFDRAAFA